MTRKEFEPGPLAEVSCELGKGEATLIFTRTLRHPPEKVWRALTDPREQLEWMPFVANRNLASEGPMTLRMTDLDGAAESPAAVLRAEPVKFLSYRWGDDLLTWELSPLGSGTRLTLRHTTETPERLSSFAAGWHICLDVLERFLDGHPVGRIVGSEAIEYGWSELSDDYQRALAKAT
jgi:uncharacterized protein YndB with AHSA1/START domain